MNPDLLAALIAYLRQQPALVTAFGDNPSAAPPIIKFWSDYAGPNLPALPYLVLTEPQDTAQFETATSAGDIGPGRDGVVGLEVFAASKADVRSLAEQVAAVLVDPPLSIASTGLIYFRPTDHRFPIVTDVGPDGSPTAFARSVQFRFITEPQ